MAEIANLTQDANNWDEWDVAAAGTEVTTNVSAGLNGTAAGILYTISGTVTTAPEFDLSAATETAGQMRFGLYVNLNTLSISSTPSPPFYGFIRISRVVGDEFLRLDLVDTGSGIFLRMTYTDDNSTEAEMNTAILPSGTFTIEIVIDRASSAVANDGKYTIYINNGQDSQDTGVDNFNIFSGAANNGYIHVDISSQGTVTGLLFADEIIFRDDATPIFIFSGYDLVLGGGQV